jgi:hypothetical protein
VRATEREVTEDSRVSAEITKWINMLKCIFAVGSCGVFWQLM